LDLDFLLRSVVATGLDALHLGNDVLTLFNAPENDVLAVQMRGLLESDEELRAIGVLARIRHTEQVPLSVTQPKVLILKLGPIDTLTTRAIAVGEVSALRHKALNNAVEDTVLEVERTARPRSACLSSAELSEVLSSAGHDVGEELKHYFADWFATDFDVEVDARVFG